MAVRVVPSTGEDDRHRAGAAADGRSQPRADVFGDVAGWLRDLVWSLGPVAPGIGVSSAEPVAVDATVGGVAAVRLAVTNLQPTPTTVAFWPSPLRSLDGHEWLPDVVSRTGVIVGGSERRTLGIDIAVPTDLPAGEYRGSLVGLALGGLEPSLVVRVEGGTP